jgi:hypothetical protein
MEEHNHQASENHTSTFAKMNSVKEFLLFHISLDTIIAASFLCENPVGIGTHPKVTEALD